jgi:ATP synthase protein I
MAEQNDQKKPEKFSDKMSEWRKNQVETYREYVRTSAVGLEFGLSIVVGSLLGYFADRYFNTAPYGLIVGIVIGSIAAGKRMWTFVKSYLEKNRNDEKK